MPLFKIIFFCFLTQISQSAFALESPDLLPPEQAFKVSAQAIAPDQVELSWDIAKGYYLYRKKNALRIQDGRY